jgi:glycosyltransferase involved in cell wall biosynthesis
MRLLIVSTAPFIYKEKGVYAYGPYVNELVVWNNNASSIGFCCPVWEADRGLLISKIPFEINKNYKLVDLNGLSFNGKIQSLFFSFYNIAILLKAFYWADHIHIRCPGNIGLLGCFVQMFFPRKAKSAKYAGNWDPQSKQPWSYQLQKWILSNAFLTRNMQVLVYGDWSDQSKNIKPFFTATYSEKEKLPLQSLNLSGNIKFVFVGSLVKGKNPLYSVQLLEALIEKGHQVSLALYGEGVERESLQEYINNNNLESNIILKGNQNREVIKKAYQESHFVVLASQSEGWPKAIAEAMFWGCVPLATAVSCVPSMLGFGKRGVLLEMNLDKDLQQIELLLHKQSVFEFKSVAASTWSRKYTVEVFETEIKKLLLGN